MSALTSWTQRLGSQRWFARVGRAYVPVDRLIGRLTRGRFVALGLPGVPSMLLTTIGRKTGQPRTTPLLFAPDGDGYVVIGSNWGQPHHPAWSGNLLADPSATILLDGRTIPVRATLVDGDDRARLRESLLRVWPAYATYETRSGGRDIRIFRLAPADATVSADPDAAVPVVDQG